MGAGMMHYHKFGAVPSQPDERDHIITRLVPKLNLFPEEYRIPYNHPVKNQGDISSCVAHSFAYIREIVEERQSGRYNPFSVGFIYANRGENDLQESGLIPREALKRLKSYGDVFYSDFPYNEEYPDILSLFEPVKDKLVKKAHPYRITAYARINTFEDYKSAIMQLGPVTLCCPVYESFYYTGSDGIVPVPDTENEKFLGYHEMTGLGWRRDNSKVILNSWGKDWGDRGYCYLPDNYPIQEMWSITDKIEPHPSPDPNEHKFYRVQIGLFDNKQSADEIVMKLEKSGFKGFVIESDGKFTVQAGAFHNKVRALELNINLRSHRYKSFIKYY